jgi:hypothetical protein
MFCEWYFRSFRSIWNHFDKSLMHCQKKCDFRLEWRWVHAHRMPSPWNEFSSFIRSGFCKIANYVEVLRLIWSEIYDFRIVEPFRGEWSGEQFWGESFCFRVDESSSWGEGIHSGNWKLIPFRSCPRRKWMRWQNRIASKRVWRCTIRWVIRRYRDRAKYFQRFKIFLAFKGFRMATYHRRAEYAIVTRRGWNPRTGEDKNGLFKCPNRIG